jgi:hypothetical protein
MYKSEIILNINGEGRLVYVRHARIHCYMFFENNWA